MIRRASPPGSGARRLPPRRAPEGRGTGSDARDARGALGLSALVGVPALRVAVAFASLLGAVWVSSAPVEAQTRVGNCRVLPGTRNAEGRSMGGGRVVYVQRPRLACEGGIRINADSMVAYEATGFNQLMGAVMFEDESRLLLARNARYFDQVGRLEADGDVELTERESGNVLTGDNLLYLREGFGRQEEELTVWGERARALLQPGSSGEEGADGAEATPYDVEASRIFLRGESYVRAIGDVVVVRDSLDARADTLFYDEEVGRLLLQGSARVLQAEYDLSGRTVVMVLPGDTIRELEARGEAELIGEELDLDAPIIRMAFDGGELSNLWASPFRPGKPVALLSGQGTLPVEVDSLDLTRPVANATDFRIEADSLDVLAPGERLERMVAVGSAMAVSTARDSLNNPDTPEVVRNDWIAGDTVVAYFRAQGGEGSVAGPEGTGRAGATPDTLVSEPRPAVPEAGSDSVTYVLDRLHARVDARSLYRMVPDSTGGEGGAMADPAARSGEEDPEEEAPADPLAAAELAGAAERAEAEADPDAPDVVVTRQAPELPGAPPTDGRPAIHYVTAEEILIIFQDGEVERMEVKGLKEGVYLEPSGRVARRSGPPAEGREAPS